MVFRKRKDVVARPEGSKTLIFQQSTGRVSILNSTSTFLWEHCDGHLTVEQLTELLRQCYEIPQAYSGPPALQELVTRHLEVLQKAEYLEIAPAA